MFQRPNLRLHVYYFSGYTDYAAGFIGSVEQNPGRFCLRQALKDAFIRLDLPALKESERFLSAAGGKPYLVRAEGDEFTTFNMSVSGDDLAVAVSDGTQIGVDVESRSIPRKVSSLEAVMTYYFQEDERLFVHGASDEKLFLQRFLLVWTRKEAGVKCLGKSIGSHGMLVNGLGKEWVDEESGRLVRMEDLAFPDAPGLQAALAAEGGAFSPPDIIRGNGLGI